MNTNNKELKIIEKMLVDLEKKFWDYQEEHFAPPEFSTLSLRASTKIFSEVLLSKMWLMQVKENMPKAEKMKMAIYAGTQIHKLVLEMTNINTQELYV